MVTSGWVAAASVATTSALIAGGALLFAIVSFLVSLHTASVAGRRARMPALVFVYDTDYKQWVLRNVGNGPALDVTIAQRNPDTKQWYNPVRIPPLSRDDQFLVWWLNPTRDFGLGARYHDMIVGDSRALRHVYVTRTGNDVSKIYQGRHSKRIDMPTWDDAEVTRHWALNRPPHPLSALTERDMGRVTRTPESASRQG
jgi:hypothetical protein